MASQVVKASSCGLQSWGGLRLLGALSARASSLFSVGWGLRPWYLGAWLSVVEIEKFRDWSPMMSDNGTVACRRLLW
jgi:hypothetical protein